MYNGEELIDVSKIDMNNEEVMKRITSTLNNIYYEGSKSLRRFEEQQDINMQKANEAIEKSDVERIEKRKTFLSKLFFIIGSAFKPELMPLSMYQKQTMPDDKRNKFNEYNSKAKGYQTRIQENIHLLNQFRSKYEDMWKNALLTNENKLAFLGKVNSFYSNLKTTLRSLDTLLMYRMMESYNYMVQADEEKYATHGIGFIDTNMHDKLKELNNWYVNEYKEQKTR